MSILIRGAEMPQNCAECPCEQSGYCQALDGTHFGEYKSRPEWCPLVEVKTPHGRLIDGDALIKDIQESIQECREAFNEAKEKKDEKQILAMTQAFMTFWECRERAKNAPTVVESEE